MKTWKTFLASGTVLVTLTASASTLVEVRCWNPLFETEQNPRTRIDIRSYDWHARASLFDAKRFGSTPLAQWDVVHSTIVPDHDSIFIAVENRFMLAIKLNGAQREGGESSATGRLMALYSFRYNGYYGDEIIEERSIDERVHCKLLSR